MFKLIFWILVLVLALSFFGISLRAIVDSPAGQANIQYIWSLLQALGTWILGLLAAKI